MLFRPYSNLFWGIGRTVLKLLDLYLQANKRCTFTSMAKSFMCERSVSDANDGRIVAYGRIIVG